MSDPNWLLSALAQSTAAIVAIIGGLVATRIIAVSIEIVYSDRRLEDLQRADINLWKKREIMNTEMYRRWNMIGYRQLIVGMIVLAIFAVLGIVVPVLKMPVDPYHYSSWSDKWVPITLFLFGLFMVISYIFFLVLSLKKLVKKESNTTRSTKDPTIGMNS